jgi:TonB family protein
MKICPKCAQSFADGFKYCPRDATELTKYDLRAQIYGQSGLQFLVKNKSLWSRLRDEIADAVRELKRNPHKYLSSLLRGEGSSRRRRRLLQAGVAMAVVTYTSLVLLVLLVGLLKAPMTGTIAENLQPKYDFTGPVRLAFEDEKPAADTKKGRGLLGGVMTQPRRSGGGGGANDKKTTSKGQISFTSLSPQINLPDISQPKDKPLLVVQETIVVDPIFSRRLINPIGIQDGQLEAPSRGDRGGTGIGKGRGPGYDSGTDGNTGDGPNKIGGGHTTGPDGGGSILSGKPTLLYTERAKYTEEARRERIQGTVVLSVVFGADSLLHDIRTLQGLPYGLTESAIEAAKHIRFQPAVRYGKPVNVRTVLEFNFALY